MDVGPSVKAIEYADASMELIKAAKEELSKGDVRQAAEKAWVWLRWRLRLTPTGVGVRG